MKILVCDDEQAFVDSLVERLKRIPEVEEQFEVVPFSGLEACVKELEARRSLARDEPDKLQFDDGFAFDNAEIVIVDYDLIKIRSEGFLTGEGVAYLARCFSNAGYIVALNQFDRTRAFDLTLRGHPESFADLNLAADDLDNSGLWKRAWTGPYRPWYWPTIPDAARAFRKRVESLKGNLDAPISAFLGFPDGLANVMPRDLQAFVAAREEQLTGVTFRAFVTDSGQGVRGRDRTSDAGMERIAAARVATWLELVVLPGQDLLVDLPHLVERAPSILRARDPETLQSVCTIGVPDTVDTAAIDGARFELGEWLSRPAWWWLTIDRNEALPEVAAPWEGKPLIERFAEDVSRFAGPEHRKQFVSALTSSYVRRFVSDPQVEGVSYRPAVRFAMA